MSDVGSFCETHVVVERMVQLPAVPAHGGIFNKGWQLLTYPNPAHASFTIALKDCPEREVNLRLLSLAGKTVYQARLPVTDAFCSKTVYLPDTVCKGIYFLVAQGQRSARFEKIVLE